MENPNYYAIIPANVRYDNKLKANEKLMYGEITALSQKDGRCFASNSYFAQLYGVDKSTVSRWISNLEKKQYIKTEIIYGNNAQIINRYIQINHYPIDKKIITPIDKKIIDNNTSINNTSLIIKNNKQKSEDFGDFNFSQDFKDVFFLYEKHRKEKKSKLTETARNQILKKSSAVGEKIAIEKIQESIQNGRTGVFFDKEQKQKNKPKLACEDKTKDFNFLD